MKPSINKIIYTIVDYQIAEETVKFLGENSFLVNHYEDYTHGYEFNYNEYNVNWFTSFDKAKRELKKRIKEKTTDKFKLVEYKDLNGIRFWEVELQ